MLALLVGANAKCNACSENNSISVPQRGNQEKLKSIDVNVVSQFNSIFIVCGINVILFDNHEQVSEVYHSHSDRKHVEEGKIENKAKFIIVGSLSSWFNQFQLTKSYNKVYWYANVTVFMYFFFV